MKSCYLLNLIKGIILILFFNIFQERASSNNNYEQDSLSLKYRLDNEFDLVFVIAFQKILQLSYVDKFLDDIQLEFRDKYKNDLARKNYFMVKLYLNINIYKMFIYFFFLLICLELRNLNLVKISKKYLSLLKSGVELKLVSQSRCVHLMSLQNQKKL